MTALASVELARDDKLLRIRLSRPKANVLDAAMIAALQTALDQHQAHAHLRAVLLEAKGPHFSFGASVEEHLPERCAEMLRGFHRLIATVVAYPVPVLVAMQGQCLGGGLELVCAAHVIFAAPGTKVGQPEANLGVFAPAASVLLPEKLGRPLAEELLLSGRTIEAAAINASGWVHSFSENPADAALAWFDAHLAVKSAIAIRHATKAARLRLCALVESELASLEHLYLNNLMRTRDPVEGLRAFLDKRPARWEDC